MGQHLFMNTGGRFAFKQSPPGAGGAKRGDIVLPNVAGFLAGPAPKTVTYDPARSCVLLRRPNKTKKTYMQRGVVYFKRLGRGGWDIISNVIVCIHIYTLV